MPQLPATTTEDRRIIDEAAEPPLASLSLARVHRAYNAILVNRVGRSPSC